MKLKKRAIDFYSEKVDTTLPDPANLPYTADQWDFLYTLYIVYERLGKRFLPSQIIAEYNKGYGWMLDGVMDIESFYGKLREDQRPKDGRQTN